MENCVVDELLKMDELQLAETYVDCNRWLFPRHLSENLKPKWWDTKYSPMFNAKDRQTGFIKIIMDYCELKVSKEIIDRVWTEETTHQKTN